MPASGIRLVALSMLFLLDASAAYADSDGYYCVGRGYLAYQFGMAAPPVGPHRLFVVRFGSPAGIQAPVEIALPQFQVHGILCGEHTIQVAAYDAIYTVRLDSTNRPVSYDAIPWADHRTTPRQFIGQSLNLGASSREGSTVTTRRERVGDVEGGGQYILEISGTPIPGDRCRSHVASKLVKTDRNGRQTQQLEIFQGFGVRECGD